MNTDKVFKVSLVIVLMAGFYYMMFDFFQYKPECHIEATFDKELKCLDVSNDTNQHYYVLVNKNTILGSSEK